MGVETARMYYGRSKDITGTIFPSGPSGTCLLIALSGVAQKRIENDISCIFVKLKNNSCEIENFVETHLRKLCGTSIAPTTGFVWLHAGYCTYAYDALYNITTL